MDGTPVFFGLIIVSALLYGVVFLRLKVRSWLSAKRLAGLETGVQDGRE